MRHGSLFSGIGGFDLAAGRMGWENVFYCEKDSFCNKILQYYWPEADGYTDIKKFNGSRYEGHVDIVSGGFPCQPFSYAGKRRGKKDDRYLFPQALRVIKEVGPSWIVLENVTGLFSILEPDSLSKVEHKAVQLFCSHGGDQADESTIIRVQKRVLGTIVSELHAAGYVLPRLTDGTPVVLCVPACAFGAVHRRDRVWIIAHADRQRCSIQHRTTKEDKGRRSEAVTTGTCIVSDTRQIWPTESPFCSPIDVFPQGLDGETFSGWRRKSLKVYGNAIVPEVAYHLFRVIQTIENDTKGM